MIKHAEKQDVDSIMALCAAATQDMLTRGIDQWDEFYPTKDIFAVDIEAGTMYALWRGTEILAVIVLNQEQEPEYTTVNWQFNSEPIGIIHRLMVHPSAQGKGIASKLLAFAENVARQSGYGTIRLDVFSKNPTAIHLYEKHGYRRAGTVVFRKGEFFCMEKQLDKHD